MKLKIEDKEYENYLINKINGNPQQMSELTLRRMNEYEQKHTKIVFVNTPVLYICNCEKYPLIWIWWWFYFRLVETWQIIDTALDYIMQVWGLVTATAPNQCLTGFSKRLIGQINKIVKG